MSTTQKSVIGNENVKVVFFSRVLSNTVLQWKCFVRLWHH